MVVQSSPTTADLWMDGQAWGKTSHEQRAGPSGQHEIMLRVPGVPPSSYTIGVAETDASRYLFELQAVQ